MADPESDARSVYNRILRDSQGEAFNRSTFNYSYKNPGSAIGEPVRDNRDPAATDFQFRTPNADVIVAPDRTTVNIDIGSVTAGADRSLTVTTNNGTVRVNDPALAAEITGIANRVMSVQGRGPVMLLKDSNQLAQDAAHAISEAPRTPPGAQAPRPGRGQY